MPKAIIFDFGNVLFKLNLDLFHTNLVALINEDVSNGYPQPLVEAVNQYHSGLINTETFIWKIQHYKKGNLSPRTIINTWNSMLDGFPENRWEFLKEVRKKYKLFLLSNINELHLDLAYKHISKVHGKVDFETEYFDAVFYSHIIKLIKPDPRIYEFVENVIGFKGEDILFIDDSLENISAAKKAGWLAIHHDPKLDIVNEFSSYISSL